MRMNAMFGVVGVAVAMFAATAAFADPVKVAVGYVTATDFTPVFVAKEKGIFAKHDLDVDPKRIPIIVNIPAALMTGDLQIGAATMPLLLQSADGGLDMQLVSGGARHLQSNSKIALMVRTGLKIEKPEDLKGKKIGVAGFNSTMDIFLRKWLRLKGLGDKDVTRVEANFPQMPDLLKAGTVDAVTITDPMRSIAIKQGVGYVYAEYAAELLPDVLMIGYISNGDLGRKRTRRRSRTSAPVSTRRLPTSPRIPTRSTPSIKNISGSPRHREPTGRPRSRPTTSIPTLRSARNWAFTKRRSIPQN
jgi:NitT/TauT family transport system substrate-binding protein